MLKNRSPHVRAVVQALFVTFFWSTSWVLIKFGLKDIPALPFAGLRYTLNDIDYCDESYLQEEINGNSYNLSLSVRHYLF